MRVWVCLIWRATSSLKDLHTWTDLCRGCSVEMKGLKSDPKAEGRRKSMGEAPFIPEYLTALLNLSGSSELSRRRKELYRELGVRRRSTPIGIRRWVRASWKILSSRSPGSLHWMCCLFSAWTSEQAWQTCPIVLVAAVAWKKRLSTPSTTASENSPVLGTRRRVDSSHRTEAARAARRWLRHRQRFTSVSMWEARGVSHNPSYGQNGDLDDAKEGIVWRCKLFSSRFDIVLYASA